MPTYVIYYSQGNTNGPFDIYLSGSSGLNLYASDIERFQLENGYTITFPDGIPSSSVDIFDVAYGCFTDQNVPFPSPSPSVTPTISITPSRTPTISVSPTVTPSITRTPSVTPSFTPPPSITRTPTVTVTPSRTPNISNSPTPTPSITRTPPASVPPTYYGYRPSRLGYTQAYQACYAYNQGDMLGIYTYLNTSTPQIGTRIFTLYAVPYGTYVPINGYNLWYALATWFPVTAQACQIDTDGYITNIALTNYCT